MNQFIGFCVLLAGLFGIATMLLWRLPWPKREPWRTLFEGLIVVADLILALWLNRYFSQHSYELITTTLACSHFSFVCFWCVTSRGPSLLRLVLFLTVVAAMFALFNLPKEYFVYDDAMEQRDWIAVQALTQRLISTCVATWLAGIVCRLRGWRLESPQDIPREDETGLVRAVQTVPLLVFLVVAVPCVMGIHNFVSSNWTSVFNRDFSILALGCFYGLLMLAVLAVTVCRFKPQWIGGGIAFALVAWLLYELGDKQYDSFEIFRFALRYQPGGWTHYSHWLALGTLWWWLVWKHLQGVGFSLRSTDESILTRPKLKHVMIAMAFMAVLFSSVKSRYFDRYEDLIRQRVRYAEPRQGPIETLVFSQSVPQQVTRNLGRLKKLQRVGFQHCTIDEDLMQKVLQLKDLEALSFVSCDLGTTGLKGIESLTALKHVEFVNCKTAIPTEDFRLLSLLPNLKYVALSDLANASLLSLPGVEHLDLRHCPLLNANQLDSINLESVQIINFPRDPKDIAFDGVPDARRYPRLTELKLKLKAVGPSDIATIKQFSDLERLEVIGCEKGIELLQGLEIKRLSLRDCTLTGETLDELMRFDNVKSLELSAVPPQKFVEQHIDKFALIAKQYESVNLELYGGGGNLGGLGMAGVRAAMWTTSAMPFHLEVEGTDNLFYDIADDTVILRTDGRSNLSNVTIDFKVALELLKFGPFDFHNINVTHRDRLITKHIGTLYSMGLPWYQITADELSQILKAHQDKENFYLVDPQLSPDDYSQISSSKLKRLTLIWSQVPDDWEQVLGKLIGSSIKVDVQMPDDPNLHERQDALSKKAGDRLEFGSFAAGRSMLIRSR